MEEIDDYQISQANALVYGSSSMTLREKRLFYLAVCKIAIHDTKFIAYSVPVEQLKDYLGLKGDSIRSELKHICNQLLTRVVSIETERGWLSHQYVSHCEYIKAQNSPSGQAILEIKLHDKVKFFLLQLRNRFQSIKFEYLSRMASIYALRIFEILWHKRHDGKVGIRNKIIIEVSDIRRMLKLENKYKNYKDFRKHVIDKSQKEIKKNTPIAFTYEEKKQGRKIVSITFTVYENDDYKAEKLTHLTTQMILDLNETDTPKERSKIIWSHVSKHLNYKSWHKEYEQWIEQGKTHVQIEKSAEWAASEIDRKSKTGKPVESLAGFVRWAVRENKV